VRPHPQAAAKVNAGVLADAVAAHSATAYRDQAYTEPRRRVTPVEQHVVHSLLEVSPIMATFLLAVLHWDQAKALAGQDRQPPRFRPRLKRRDPLSPAARVTLLAAVTAFGILPYAEELLRCWHANHTLSPLPEPAEPATDTLRAQGQDQASDPSRSRRLSDRGSRTPGRHPRVQSSGEAMPITSPISRVRKGRALTVSASTAVDRER
jgi:hypothetical protein